MRVVHIVAGAGGMYCGSCLHGNTLTNALRAADNLASLVATLKQMILDPSSATRYGRQAQEAVRRRYNAPLMAEKISEWYRKVLADRSPQR